MRVFGLCRFSKSVLDRTFRPVRDFRLENLRVFIAEVSAPGDFFQSPNDCGSPDCGCSDFADFPSRCSIERFARCETFALKIFGFSLLKVPRRAIFFQSPNDCGSPDCGCSDFADFLSVLEKFARCGTFALNFFGFSLLEVPRRAIFFKVRTIAGHPIAGGWIASKGQIDTLSDYRLVPPFTRRRFRVESIP